MGGEGTLQGAMFGALLMGIINNGLRLMGVPSIYHSVVKGIVIITAVAIDIYVHYRDSGLLRHSERSKFGLILRSLGRGNYAKN